MASKFDQMKASFKKKPKSARVAAIFVIIAAIALFIILAAYAVGTFSHIGMALVDHDMSFMDKAMLGMTEHFMLVMGITAGAIAVILLVFMHSSLRNEVFSTDDRGVSTMEKGTFGTSRWLTPAEISDKFEVTDIRKTTAPVYGQITKDGGGKDVVAFKKKPKGASGNKNVLVMASMGSGKSYGPVRVNLIQSILRGESFVATDPSAELYSSLSDWCRRQGADVHVINLDKPEYSEFWDILEETISPETERLDSQRLNDFVNIYMSNSVTNEKEAGNFWAISASNIITVVIGYAAFLHEKEIIDKFCELYSAITGKAAAPEIDTMKNTLCSFKTCRKFIKDAAGEKGLDPDKIDRILHDIQYTAPKNRYDIKTVHKYLLEFNGIVNDLGIIPEWHPARTAFLTFQTNDTPQVRQSALQGAQQKFQIFSDTNLKEMLSHPGIHIDDITNKLSAYFIILSDKTTTTKPIASLFFTFLFKDAQDAWDVRKMQRKSHPELPPRLELTCMMDEFFSIGVIGGDPNKFGVTMSNSRKREIHIWIIVQSYSQLAALYGPEIGNVIQGGCSTLLYLGGNDPDTVDFISTFAAGTATVGTESHQESAGLLSPVNPPGSISVSQRNLITPDEARRWKDRVLIVKQGELITEVSPFPWDQHYVYKESKEVDLYDMIQPMEERISRIKEEDAKYGDKDAMISAEIREITAGIKKTGSKPSAAELLGNQAETAGKQAVNDVGISDSSEKAEANESMHDGQAYIGFHAQPTANSGNKPVTRGEVEKKSRRKPTKASTIRGLK